MKFSLSELSGDSSIQFRDSITPWITAEGEAAIALFAIGVGGAGIRMKL